VIEFVAGKKGKFVAAEVGRTAGLPGSFEFVAADYFVGSVTQGEFAAECQLGFWC
jgi:hypothetical protein